MSHLNLPFLLFDLLLLIYFSDPNYMAFHHITLSHLKCSLLSLECEVADFSRSGVLIVGKVLNSSVSREELLHSLGSQLWWHVRKMDSISKFSWCLKSTLSHLPLCMRKLYVLISKLDRFVLMNIVAKLDISYLSLHSSSSIRKELLLLGRVS